MPLPRGSLEQLLTAEIALKRFNADTAFAIYLEQARQTKAPAVLATATQLAARLRRPELIELARLWLGADPGATEPRRLLAVEYQDRGDYRRSLQQLVALRNLGADAPVDDWLGSLREAPENQQLDALNQLRDFRKNLPDDPLLVRAEASLLSLLGRLNEALTLLLGSSAKDDQLIRATVQVLVELERVDEARRVIQTRIAGGGDASEWRMELVDHLLRTQSWAAARQELETLLASRIDSDEVLLSLAYVALQENDTVRVREAVAPLLNHGDADDSGSGRALAWFYLGQAAEREHKWSQAAAAYRQVPSGEHYLQAQSRVAAMMIKERRFDEAQLHLARLRIRHVDAAADLFLVEYQLLAESQATEQARAALEEGLAAFPENAALLYARGMSYYQGKQMDLAESDFRRVLAFDEFHLEALNALGYLLADRQDSGGEALSLIARALDLAPEDASVLDSMGWVQYRLGNQLQALHYLERAWRAKPDAEIAAHYGEVLWVAGQMRSAERIWAEGLKLDPANSTIVATQRRLRVSGKGARAVNAATDVVFSYA